VLSWPEAVDGRRSNVIVSLNGQLVDTIELRGGARQQMPMRVTLPPELLRPGPNALRLETRLYAADQRDTEPVCESSAPERLWLTVHSDSAVSFPGDSDAGARTLDLGALPYPFAGRAGLRETAIVVDPMSPASLRAGLLAAIALGRLGDAEGRAAEIEVLPQAEATPERLGARHVVVAGLAPGGPLDGALADALPLLLAPDGTRRLLAGAETLAELLTPAQLGAVQEAPAPWAPERRLLVLQGTDDVAPPPTPVAERFTERESRARQLAALALIAAGAAALLVAWALRDRIARMI
jgi:cellulose synthase (UDP-forming)